MPPSSRSLREEIRNRRAAGGVIRVGDGIRPLTGVPQPEFDLDACLKQVVQGDEDAARALVARCHPLVVRLVRAHRPRTIGEDDLEQEVFLKMFTMLPRYEARDGQLFEHWLARLAVRTCRDALRGESRRADNLPLSAGAQEWLGALASERQPEVGDALAARELVDALLAELPPEDRLVLTLLDLDQRSTAEIAALTGWSRALVKVRAFRARLRLRALVRQRREAAMAEFDERWERLLEKAREANAPLEGLSAQRVRELAALARQRPQPRPSARLERQSLVALAALLACVLLALVPWRAEVGEFVGAAGAELASLPSRVTRPPQPPSPALLIAAVPDLRSILDLRPLTSESQP